MRPSLALALALALAACAAAAAPAAAAAAADCFATPADAACASFTVDNSILVSQLAQVCSGPGPAGGPYGWPSACTLRAECAAGRAGRAFCSPLRLVLTACKEAPDLLFCPRYTALCGAQSAVRQCEAAAPIEVPTGDAAFASAVALCKQMDMPGCADCAPGAAAAPGTVQAQALQVQCPDPLGSLSTMCKDMWMPGCAGWEAFCAAAANNTAFPALCDARYVPAAGAAAVAAETLVPLNCIQHPARPECASYEMAPEAAGAAVGELCASMPNMVGCTLQDECLTGRASGPLCSNFTLYATLCEDMPSMSACATYASLCKAPGSGVRQCATQGPVAGAPSTAAATAAVRSICGDHSMAGCEECASPAACPHPFHTLHELCQSMPGMAACAAVQDMCAGAGAADTFGHVCGSAPGDSLPPMKMWLHSSTRDIILLREWVPASVGAYVAACLAVAALAVGVQALKALRVLQEARWAAAASRATCCGDACAGGGGAKQRGADADSGSEISLADERGLGGGAPAAGGGGGAGGGRRRRGLPTGAQLRRNASRAAFTVAVVFLDYMLMLIVMTFNIGLIAAAVAGFGAGALAFGHLGERAGGGGAVAVGAGEVAPDSENDLEVHFVDPQPCCNTQRV